MMRALFSSVSGLRNHQTWMDVIGNNIANSNTVGFKASRVTFQESFVQQLTGASRPTGTLAGVNPMQVGSGVGIGSIDQLFSQGTLENTGQPLDMAIQGNSLFVLSRNGTAAYARAGNFQLDGQGHLTAPASGMIVQGVNADPYGKISNTAAPGDIRIRLGEKAPAKPTSSVELAGNLNASAAIGESHSLGITGYDKLGAPHELRLTFVNTAPGEWSWTASSATAAVTPAGAGSVSFNTNGSLKAFTYPGGGSTLTMTPPGGDAINVALDAGTADGINGLVGFAGTSDAVASSQDGYAAGDLVNLLVDSQGMINGVFSNGTSRPLAQLALATFTNPGGLISAGNNTWSVSSNSGEPVIGYAGETITDTITPGALESSNVDLSQEFTNMIIAQRGYQADARVITTADQMLNEVVNLRQ